MRDERPLEEGRKNKGSISSGVAGEGEEFEQKRRRLTSRDVSRSSGSLEDLRTDDASSRVGNEHCRSWKCIIGRGSVDETKKQSRCVPSSSEDILDSLIVRTVTFFVCPPMLRVMTDQIRSEWKDPVRGVRTNRTGRRTDEPKEELTSSGKEELKGVEGDQHTRSVRLGNGDSHQNDGSSKGGDWVEEKGAKERERDRRRVSFFDRSRESFARDKEQIG